MQHSQNSESDPDMDRRSLDLASSHTSDDEYDTNNIYEPSEWSQDSQSTIIHNIKALKVTCAIENPLTAFLSSASSD